MYLNVRQPPLRSKLPFALFSKLFPRTSPSPTYSSTPPSPTEGKRRSASPDAGSRGVKRSSSVPIAPIPPASNPRGELIFSSRVDRTFRDSYERYRNAFERRREERERTAYEATWVGWLVVKVLRLKPPASSAGVAAAGSGSGAATPVGRTASLAGSVRGRASPAGTPSSSRRSSPVPRKTRRSSLVGASPLATAAPLPAERSEPISE